MYRQLYYAGGEGIASLDAGAPSIKYTGDIKPEMASSYIGGPGGPMSQMNDYSMQIYGKPLNELTGDELEELKNILRTPQASAPSPSSDLYDQFINMQQNGTIPKDMDFDSFKDLIREQASSEGGIMEVAPREQALFGGIKKAVAQPVSGGDTSGGGFGEMRLMGKLIQQNPEMFKPASNQQNPEMFRPASNQQILLNASSLNRDFIDLNENGIDDREEQALSEEGIMQMVPREQALFGGIKKAVKKVTGAVKDVVKSDLGKAALAGAALYYGGGGNLFGFQRAGLATPGFAFSNLPGASFLGDKFSGVAKSQIGKKLIEGVTSKTALVGLGGAALSLLSDAGLSEEEIQRAQENPEVLKGYLRSSFTRVNPRAEGEDPASYEARVNAFVEENTREYRADGGITSIDPDDLPMSKEGFPKYYTPEGKEISFKEFQKAMKDKKPLLPKKKPSRKNKAKGGIMDIPVRKNKAGVEELDYRKKGGFVPPIGIKEKADDIPAMLSNNEFVFTADAVRGAGGGSVNKGAQKMYKLMKQLEKRGIV